MSFILTDCGDEDHTVMLANRFWRPIADVIVTAGLVSGTRAETLAFHLGTRISEPEARAIARHLDALSAEAAAAAGVRPDLAAEVAAFAARCRGFSVG